MPPKIVLATSPFLLSFQGYDQSIGVVDHKNPTLDGVKGVIFSGGSDISPSLYFQKNLDSYPDPERDFREVAVYHLAKAMGLKIFGVCRGHQLINALEGGVLTQDLSHASTHELNWVSDSGIQVYFPHLVNSMHHQGYLPNQIAPTLKVKACEPHTGIVEVAESISNDLIKTVQFHPEFMGSFSVSFFEYILDWLRR